MGNGASAPEAPAPPMAAGQKPPTGCPMHESSQQKPAHAISTSATECPMHESQRQPASDCPSTAGAGCPMHESQQNQPINPLNNEMPPNQLPSPDQPFALPVDREVSTIPKGGTGDEKWVYPSQQMFWNAMLRKGWKWEPDAIEQKDMDAIIKIHNRNNEDAWLEVLKWESLHAHECGNPKLLRFGGKAKKFSPRARLRSWMGYELPFDRHDWIIDRCGREVRYVIDYYDGGGADDDSATFVRLDVRPAFDSFGAIFDRARVATWRWRAEFGIGFSAPVPAPAADGTKEE